MRIGLLLPRQNKGYYRRTESGAEGRISRAVGISTRAWFAAYRPYSPICWGHGCLLGYVGYPDQQLTTNDKRPEKEDFSGEIPVVSRQSWAVSYSSLLPRRHGNNQKVS